MGKQGACSSYEKFGGGKEFKRSDTKQGEERISKSKRKKHRKKRKVRGGEVSSTEKGKVSVQGEFDRVGPQSVLGRGEWGIAVVGGKWDGKSNWGLTTKTGGGLGRR